MGVEGEETESSAGSRGSRDTSRIQSCSMKMKAPHSAKSQLRLRAWVKSDLAGSWDDAAVVTERGCRTRGGNPHRLPRSYRSGPHDPLMAAGREASHRPRLPFKNQSTPSRPPPFRRLPCPPRPLHSSRSTKGRSARPSYADSEEPRHRTGRAARLRCTPG